MKVKLLLSAGAIVLLALIAFTAVTTAQSGAKDATLSAPTARYVPTLADLSYSGQTAGDVAEADVAAVGTDPQYSALILNGDGVNANAPHPFLKVQQGSINGNFSNAGCYLGNNASAGVFGLDFWVLSQEFSTAHMKASRSGSTVTIEFTNVNGGTLPNQTYVCTGAPSPVGDKIGVGSYANNTSTIDNFSDGASILDTFSYTGPLASSGKWTDVAPGMNANGSKAVGGLQALSFFGSSTSTCPATVAVSDVPDGRYILETLYHFRDDVLRQSVSGTRYVSMFYRDAAEASFALLRNSTLRFRVAQMLWKQQATFQSVIQHQPATVRSADMREADLLIGSFLENASPSFAADLREIRQGLRDRSLLSQYGVRVTE